MPIAIALHFSTSAINTESDKQAGTPGGGAWIRRVVWYVLIVPESNQKRVDKLKVRSARLSSLLMPCQPPPHHMFSLMPFWPPSGLCDGWDIDDNNTKEGAVARTTATARVLFCRRSNNRSECEDRNIDIVHRVCCNDIMNTCMMNEAWSYVLVYSKSNDWIRFLSFQFVNRLIQLLTRVIYSWLELNCECSDFYFIYLYLIFQTTNCLRKYLQLSSRDWELPFKFLIPT